MSKEQSPHVFVSRVHLYAVPHGEDPFWGVGWLSPEDYFCDVTPEQHAEYQRWWDENEVIDISRVRKSDWPSVIDQASRVAELLEAPAPVTPKVQPQIGGQLAVGWILNGRVWILVNMEVGSLQEYQVGIARVETDFRTGARKVTRER
ncbi:MAG TPA: hypothetical protein PLU52_09035 [Opitutaceae bacterium]|nr:hypothetical protein [Opitutaceae bacterium]